MIPRKYLFPHVIEMNYQAGQRLGVNVYLIDGGSDFLLIDIGYQDTVGEIVELIRKMDFNLSTCKMVIATHADADHIQGVARSKELLKTKVAAHPLSVGAIESGDEILDGASAIDRAVPSGELPAAANDPADGVTRREFARLHSHLALSVDGGTAVVSLCRNRLSPVRTMRSRLWQFGSGQATSMSLVIQSFGWVGRCLAASNGKTAASE